MTEIRNCFEDCANVQAIYRSGEVDKGNIRFVLRTKFADADREIYERTIPVGLDEFYAESLNGVVRQRTALDDELIANKDKEIARLEAAYTTNVEKSGARVLKTRAVLEDAHTVRLATGEAVRAKYVLIATGGAPNHGARIPGIEHVISSNEAFHLKQLPRRILIQGGGYIALEFA